MEYIIQELDHRKAELDEYLDLIEFLNERGVITNETGMQLTVSTLLLKTTKGSVYLLLYNLIEATMREAVVSIHDEISDSGSTFDDLREQLQHKILYRAKRDKISLPNCIEGIEGDISLNLHQATLCSKDLFSGNIDRDEVRAVAEIYGFSHSTDYQATGHGRHLGEVKKNRNDLAHGNKMFSDIGENTSIEHIRALTNEVVSYIYEISDNIVDSLEGKRYLKD
ncbi:MAG: MAE_28990/MAE_18760 family HEPN-like nuclease [Cycloclasticus sp.]